jgi:hypothetical protein
MVPKLVADRIKNNCVSSQNELVMVSFLIRQQRLEAVPEEHRWFVENVWALVRWMYCGMVARCDRPLAWSWLYPDIASFLGEGKKTGSLLPKAVAPNPDLPMNPPSYNPQGCYLGVCCLGGYLGRCYLGRVILGGILGWSHLGGPATQTDIQGKVGPGRVRTANLVLARWGAQPLSHWHNGQRADVRSYKERQNGCGKTRSYPSVYAITPLIPKPSEDDARAKRLRLLEAGDVERHVKGNKGPGCKDVALQKARTQSQNWPAGTVKHFNC